MEIDLNSLPIPDWGLVCPRCRYSLVGLPTHRCPECGTRFEMAEIVKPWHRLRDPRFTGRELPFPDFGLRCRRCERPLAGAPRRQCPHCDTPFNPEQLLISRGDWFIIDKHLCGEVPLAGLEALLAAELVPHQRAAGTLLVEIYGGTDIVGSRLLVPREFYFEVLWLIRRTATEMVHTRREPGTDWTCPNCGEAVPGHFDVCWQCETGRDT